MRLRSPIALALVIAAVAGCGVPSEPSKQAEEVGSVAAEGALLAHDAENGRTTAPFVRTHAEALLKLLEPLRPKIVEPELGQVAGEVETALTALADDPGAAGISSRLERAANQADELAK